MNITQKLDALVELMAERDTLSQHRQDLIDTVLTDEIKAKLQEIDIELAEPIAAVNEKIQALEVDIKYEVLDERTTVKGSHLMAVYTKPRVTWDGKKLDGMMALIPALKEARKEGEPSVTIRKI